MASRIKQVISKYWLLVFLGIIVLFMGIFKISFADIWTSISSIKLWQAAILLGVYFIVSGLNVLLRRYLLNSLSATPGLKNLFLIHFSSMAAHYSTPAKLGFPLGVFLLNRLENISYVTGTAMVVIELLVSTGVCGMIALLGSLAYFGDKSSLFPLIIFILICIVGFATGLYIKKYGIFAKRFQKIISEFNDAIKLLSFRKLCIYVFFSTAVQLFGAMNLFLLCTFFSAPLSYPKAVVTGSSAFFLGSVSMIPMGLGVREASVLFYLGRFGISDGIGLSVVTIQRLISTGLSFLLGSIIGTFLGLKGMVHGLDSTKISKGEECLKISPARRPSNH
jgi:uncharacterized protein (TIRG00374 family)